MEYIKWFSEQAFVRPFRFQLQRPFYLKHLAARNECFKYQWNNTTMNWINDDNEQVISVWSFPWKLTIKLICLNPFCSVKSLSCSKEWFIGLYQADEKWNYEPMNFCLFWGNFAFLIDIHTASKILNIILTEVYFNV